jgi:hypothetical protein
LLERPADLRAGAVEEHALICRGDPDHVAHLVRVAAHHVAEDDNSLHAAGSDAAACSTVAIVFRERRPASGSSAHRSGEDVQ